MNIYVLILNVYVVIWYIASELKIHYDTLGKSGFQHRKVRGLGEALSPRGAAVSCVRTGLETELRGIQTQKL